MSDELINSAITAIRSGKYNEGQKILSEVLDANPKNELAWLWMSVCTKSAEQKKTCLLKALEINPNNKNTIQALNKLQSPPPMPTLEEIQNSTMDQISIISSETPKLSQVNTLQQILMQSTQNDLITLACPTCGGKLNVSEGTEKFFCSYCGNEHIVRYNGNAITLEPVLKEIQTVKDNISEATKEIRGVKGSVDITASELAINRLREDIRKLKNKLEASSKPLNTSIPLLATGVIFLIINYSTQLNEIWCSIFRWGALIFGFFADKISGYQAIES